MNMLGLFMHGVRMLMPFMDRIAVRALTAFSAMFALGITLSLMVVGIRIFTVCGHPRLGNRNASRSADPLVRRPR